MNPIRHQFIQRCLRRGPPAAEDAPLDYLDVGCGGGILTESLARLPRTGSVVGIDASPAVLSVATDHARRDPSLRGKLRYLNAPIEDLHAGSFDVVTLMEVVEHVPRPAEFLSATMAHVKPGGWLALSTIARTWTSYVTTKLVAENILGIVPRGTHDWWKFINCDELREFFAGKEGWGEVLVMGCVYIPGLGWREVAGGEKVGNYFLGVRRELE
jgi:ubiquinone biosynthesis O-methyltransferase